MVTKRCVAQGRVQGVGFRHFVTRNARSLDVVGTVRNRKDGALEAVLQAEEPEPVDELVDRIRRGPRAARVDSVDVEEIERDPMSGFEVVW